MRPYDAKWSDDDAPGLKRDNLDVANFWILTDGIQVTIAEQEVGKSVSQSIAIPREIFNRLIDWYMRDQHSKQAGTSPL